MLLRRTNENYGRQTSSPTSSHRPRWRTILLLCLLVFPNELCQALRSQVTISRGPSTGIITQEIPSLLMTEHRIISQLIYVNLDIETVLAKYVTIADISDVEVLTWYDTHIDRTKETIKDILSQAEKTIIKQQPPPVRSKRAIAGAVMGVMALLTVIGTVVGSTMNAVNRVSIKDVQQKHDELQAAMNDIRESLAIQRERTADLVNIVKDTIVITGIQAERLDYSMKLHEKASLTRNLFYNVIDPILFITQTYLRQLEINVNNLVKACIPLYFVNDNLVKNALSDLHGPDLEPTQIRIAFETGTAIPMYIDTKRLHISFLLNIPLVKPDKIYQLKKVLNVGTWKDDTKIKINSPVLLAYQNSSDTYLIPQLQSCQVFKDLNYLCPGSPFTPMKGGFLCGLEDISSDTTLCDVTVTRTTDIITEAILIYNRWLVSTNAPNMTITYTRHGTFVTKPIPHSTFTVIVPKDVIVTIGSETLFYVSNDELEGGMEMINTLKPISIPNDSDLDFLLDKKRSHSLQLLIKHDNVSISDLNFSPKDISLFTSPDYLSRFSTLMWGIAFTIWLLSLTIIVLFNNSYILKALKRDRPERMEQLAVI